MPARRSRGLMWLECRGARRLDLFERIAVSARSSRRRFPAGDWSQPQSMRPTRQTKLRDNPFSNGIEHDFGRVVQV
jgi:hypothetical protein